ncbi:MAG: cyclohexa-1,5-dienecarbonyl-CoA hydratase [Planctomycetota bacterium]|nr:MAG: cyclohexa-1,5-dienecarbonyl-CoA hydratase [Planctomycetota bacterium]
MSAAAAAVAVRPLLAGAGRLLELGPPPANVLDRALMEALGKALAEAAADPDLKLVVLAGAGDHFSYGASVPEHLPGQVEAMLPAFHALLRSFDDLELPPVAAAVRGRCLGGGLELALACDRIVVAPEARLGCPEIRLGVFPPAGAALLPLRLPAGRAAGLVQSGVLLSGEEAAAAGLADAPAADDPLAAIEDWARAELLPLSASSLRHARRASRWPWRRAWREVLPELERAYLEELMRSADAEEGLRAFLAKRRPEWRNR